MKNGLVIERPESEFPELLVTVPDSWPYVELAPLYDVHMGHNLHASQMFIKHSRWIGKSRYTLTWNGGDLVENAILGSPGIFSQKNIPEEQLEEAEKIVRHFKDKILFAIPGNHEARTLRVAGFDIAKHFAGLLDVPYFPDFCFCTIRWRGNNFRIAAHHGTGSAQTAGAQRNAARKEMPWVRADLYWTGHLHIPIVDPVYQTDFDQRTGRMVKRDGIVMIAPSYLKYFGGYAAAKRYSPGILGLTPATLRPDGRIDVSVHASGKRL